MLIARVVTALAILVIGGPLIYMFGAGFFSGYGVGLPTPWNVVGTGILSLALLYASLSIVRRPDKNRNTQ
ncbi:MAG: hypothetical protein ACT4OM_05700 [Actinomycetota bacterium]